MPTLEEIKGQEQAKSLLKKDLESGNLNHAYLYAGPPGVGKTKTALAMAKAIVCSQRIDGGACGVCRNCRLVEAEKFTGVELLQPKGVTYKIEQMRELQKICYYNKSEGEYRIFILPEAERMTLQAANSMLKLLEEPPPGNIFIFTTKNTAAVLPTILSRCRIIKFASLSVELIKDKLEGMGKTSQEAEFIAHLSGGSMDYAIQLAETGEAFSRRQKALELLQEIWQARAERIIPAVKILEQEENLEELLNHMLMLARDYLVWQKTGDEKMLINRDRAESIKRKEKGSEGLPEESLLIATLTELLLFRMRLQKNANKRLALDVMVWKIYEAVKA